MFVSCFFFYCTSTTCCLFFFCFVLLPFVYEAGSNRRVRLTVSMRLQNPGEIYSSPLFVSMSLSLILSFSLFVCMSIACVAAARISLSVRLSVRLCVGERHLACRLLAEAIEAIDFDKLSKVPGRQSVFKSMQTTLARGWATYRTAYVCLSLLVDVMSVLFGLCSFGVSVVVYLFLFRLNNVCFSTV